jgi:signal transduction histidine kinase/HAMP domain-containing protein/ActR/RegA family two-component response regulator
VIVQEVDKSPSVPVRPPQAADVVTAGLTTPPTRIRRNGRNGRRGGAGAPTTVDDQLQKVLGALRAARAGDFSVRLETEQAAEPDAPDRARLDVLRAIAAELNAVVELNEGLARQIVRVERVVGREGQMTERASLREARGGWSACVGAINALIGDLVQPTTEVARVISAVAEGDFTQTMALKIEGQPVKGEFLRIGTTVNGMVAQLSEFAAQVTRVAKEVGTDGKLGGQAEVPQAAGMWRDLTDNVNQLANNLTAQVRNIAEVTTAVARGDLSKKITVDARGEVLALKSTINTMVDQLRAFASEVTRVAREVGTDGRLGGQAQAPDVGGTWKDLTDSVNVLAGNLTTQVRAISEVTDAVTKGDLTRSIEVAAQGEVAALKDKINQMITNLRETTRKNAEQDWLKTNLARFSSMMQGQKNLETVSRLIMSELTPLVSAHHGAFFMMDVEEDASVLKLTATYAYRERKNVGNRFRPGEGLVGQCALEKKSILLTHVPNDYIQINSGLGEATPLSIIVLPVLFEGEVKAVIELASFRAFSDIHQLFLDQLMESLGVVINMIGANMRTEELLEQSQSLTQELQSQSNELTVQQDELRRTNTALEKQALELEEKAQQLSMVSKYKSEFLANVSHELRTPLNSLLILARLLAENKEANLSDKQVEYARTIYASGGDLLTLINEILDRSKVESGKMPIEPREVALSEISDFVDRSFHPLAGEKELGFHIDADFGLPSTIYTDPLRLQQVLKNLLANAMKFTERGSVTLRMHRPEPGIELTNETLRDRKVIAFSVTDTGIGIPRNKHELIFEAFQQADGTTSRKYGGTGLGLSISREIARLLGGEIQVRSEVGRGSTFTLFLPERYVGPPGLEAEERGPNGASPASRWLPEPAPLRAEPQTPTDAELVGRKVLVVDDDVRNVFALTSVLESAGLDVVYADNGQAAIEVLEKDPSIDVVLMDVMMPGMDGYEAIRAIRANPSWKNKPIVAVTAKALDEDRERCLEVGASDYLPKPVDSTQLLELIRRRIRETSLPPA